MAKDLGLGLYGLRLGFAQRPTGTDRDSLDSRLRSPTQDQGT